MEQQREATRWARKQIADLKWRRGSVVVWESGIVIPADRINLDCEDIYNVPGGLTELIRKLWHACLRAADPREAMVDMNQGIVIAKGKKPYLGKMPPDYDPDVEPCPHPERN